MAVTTGTITAADSGSVSTPTATTQTLVTGTPTAGSVIEAPAAESVAVLLSGIWVGGVLFEKAVKDGTWVSCPLIRSASSAGKFAAASVNGAWEGDIGDNVGFRVRGKTLTSGSVTVNIVGTSPGGGATSTVAIDQTTPGTTNAVVATRKRGTKAFTASAPTATASSCLAANASRISALIFNNGAQAVYLGKNSSVTTGNGVPLPVGASLEDDSSTDAFFAITASGTGDLRICEVS